MQTGRHGYVRLLALAAALLSTPSYAVEAQNNPPVDQLKPNIVILLVDDLGWGDVGYHDPQVATPNIDALAARGVELDRFYVNPTCSPTRASLLTGQFATTHGVNGPIQWHSTEGLPLQWQTLPEYLKSAGYQTCLLYTSPSPRDPHLSRMPSSA